MHYICQTAIDAQRHSNLVQDNSYIKTTVVESNIPFYLFLWPIIEDV